MSESTASNTLTDLEREVRRNARHNFIVNALDGAAYWFGYSFISPAIILPLYVSHFTSNPIIIGLIPFISTAGFLIPQLFTSNFVERAPVKKWFPVNIGFFLERVPVFLFAPSAFLFARTQPVLALVLFLLLYTWFCVGAGLIIVGWQDMIAKIIPVEMRGRFFGITNFAGTASGIVGALAVAWVLDRYEFPQGYVFSFIAASVLVFLSWLFLAMAREPAVRSNKPRVSQMDYLRSLPEVIRHDANFLRYLVYRFIVSLSTMGTGFLIVYSTQHWNLPDSLAGSFIIAMQFGQSAANLFFGFLSDRKGHKLCLELIALTTAVSFALAFAAPNPIWFYLIFFLSGAVTAGTMISSIAIVMEFTAAEDRPTYIGLANTIPGIAGSLAPLLGGWLAGAAGYPVMFILSGIFGLAGFILLHWTVRDPRYTGQKGAAIGPASAV